MFKTAGRHPASGMRAGLLHGDAHHMRVTYTAVFSQEPDRCRCKQRRLNCGGRWGAPATFARAFGRSALFCVLGYPMDVWGAMMLVIGGGFAELDLSMPCRFLYWLPKAHWAAACNSLQRRCSLLSAGVVSSRLDMLSAVLMGMYVMSLQVAV